MIKGHLYLGEIMKVTPGGSFKELLYIIPVAGAEDSHAFYCMTFPKHCKHNIKFRFISHSDLESCVECEIREML